MEEWYEDQRLMTRSEFVLSQDGAPLNSTYINDTVHDYGELAKVPTVTAHALRHSHASLLISHPLVIRDRLGHKDVRTTLEIYGHLYPKSDIEASKRLEGLVTVLSE
ncbi:tyrosine-type recombinase/integrase [Loigolactobacillus coryniformis]|uniref:tyrosine-type recombinase/integrase n=1 Tax=Loigolactobacillus coryniformis TaxID=1610 RepID=UPI001644D2B7|nr:tyrosine-type recombinase/integrase [Loigolactobacillus coryniformis]